jgi:hypothetical protein
MFQYSNADLFKWRSVPVVEPVKLWKPSPVSHEQWPPDYRAIYAWRIKTLEYLRANPSQIPKIKAYYARNPSDFIMDWMDTYDPRRIGNKWVPFVFFIRQAEYIDFLHSLRNEQESGLVEKCRDAGVTWLSSGYSVWSWLYIEDDAIGWGSRKEDLVDKIGDPDSIFEKMRLIIRRLPDIFLPAMLIEKKHLTFMKCINPENGSIIAGEAGDNIGRGGRKAMYFKDESAHYERPEKVEAALGDNTRVQVDISSVNGLGNAFWRRRNAGLEWRPGARLEAGYTRVFIFDWRDHPEKTQAWYDTRRARHEREGLLHLFAQEVDRDYSAAISNTIIKKEWVLASVDAHLKIPYLANIAPPDVWSAGLDVADGGIDRNALSKRQWIIWRSCEQWGERDTGVTTRRAVASCRAHKNIRIQYDCIGVGSGIKAEFNRLVDDKVITPDLIRLVPWNAGAGVLFPYERLIPDDDDCPTNDDVYKNLKAQAWSYIARRFYKTWRVIQSIKEGEKIEIYDPEELISLDSKMTLLQSLIDELAQPTRGESTDLKTIIQKRPNGMKSPDMADSGVMMFFPMPDDYGTVLSGSYR